MTPPFIQNISKKAYANGDHFDCGDRAIAIEILDPAAYHAEPKHKFARLYRFRFADVEDADEYAEYTGITDEQAEQLVEILQLALDEDRNVIVHCTVGVCRSGDVA